MTMNMKPISQTGWFAELSFMPAPEDRLSIDGSRFVVGVLPAHLCYYAMAVLVLLPSTRHYRLSLLPFGLYVAFRAAVIYDMTGGRLEYKFQNFGHCLGMLTIAMRLLGWAFVEEPLQRVDKSGSVFTKALDLAINFRGIGWTWPESTYIPPETRPTHSKQAFILATFARLLKTLFVYDALTYIVRTYAPPGVGTPSGGSIFDQNLPPLLRYAHSSFVTIVYGPVFYFSIDMAYYFATILVLLIPGTGQRPQDWPLLSNAPWKATSLADFWGRRWHQTNRHMYIVLSKPLELVFGRIGRVFGAFFWSAVLHDWAVWGLGSGTDFASTGGFFMLMGVGVVLEVWWKQATGYKVGGFWGWVWTMTWMVVCGNMLVDAWMKTGLGGGEVLPPFAQPFHFLINRVIPRFLASTGMV